MSNLLLQTSGILIPIFVFLILEPNAFVSKNTTKQKLVFLGLLFLSILGCMASAVPLEGYHFDMRDIPLIIGILYGGYDVGAVLSVMTVAFRFYVGGTAGLEQSFASLLVHLLVLPAVFWQYKSFLHRSHKGRILAATVLGFYLSIVATIISLMSSKVLAVQGDIATFFLVFIAANTFGVTGVVFLIEKNRENELLKHRIHESDKLKVVSQLAASVAHEVRNPLTVVGGFVKLMMQKGMADDKTQTYGEIVLDELNRAQSIITDYLTFARPEVQADEAVLSDLKETISTAVNVMHPYALVHNVTVATDLADELYIRTHKDKFVQAVINILKNGIEAMPKGGTLTVRCMAFPGSAVVEIADEGVGMSSEQLQQLGNPFYSLKEQGTGLGMMVSYRIIQSIGGEIAVKSAVGSGTQFTIQLPVQSGQAKRVLNTLASPR